MIGNAVIDIAAAMNSANGQNPTPSGASAGCSAGEIAMPSPIGTSTLSTAFGTDTDFFDFYRSMSAYREAITGDNSLLVMPPDNDFFRHFNSLDAMEQAQAEERPEATGANATADPEADPAANAGANPASGGQETATDGRDESN